MKMMVVNSQDDLETIDGGRCGVGTLQYYHNTNTTRQEGSWSVYLSVRWPRIWQESERQMKFQAVHILTDGDPAACSPCVRRSGNPVAPPLPAVIVRGRPESNAGQGHHALLQEVPLKGLTGGLGGAKGEDIHDHCTVWEALSSGPVDHGQVTGKSLPYPLNLLQYMRDGDGSPAVKSYRGVPSVGSKTQKLHGRAASAHDTGHHGGNRDIGGPTDLIRVSTGGVDTVSIHHCIL